MYQIGKRQGRHLWLLAVIALFGVAAFYNRNSVAASAAVFPSSTTSLAAAHDAHPSNACATSPALSESHASSKHAVAELKRRGLYASLQKALQAALYRVEPNRHGAPHTYCADNPSQKYNLSFAADGLHVQFGPNPSSPLDMHLTGVGRGNRLSPPASANAYISGDRVEYQRGSLTEWYVNGARGVEQGFTLAERPAAGRPESNRISDRSSELTLEMAVGTAYKPQPAQNGAAIRFASQSRTQNGASLLYKDLRAWDAHGRHLPARMDVHGDHVALVVDDRKASYPITVDPILSAEFILNALDRASNDQFGYAVSINLDTAAIGAPGAPEGSAVGAVYVFTRSNGAWLQQAKLTAPDGTSSDYFGAAVALSGSFLVVGAYNHFSEGVAYIFTRQGTTWSPPVEITASDPTTFEEFGYSVAIDSTTGTAAIGAIGRKNNNGGVYIFTNSGGTWNQQNILVPTDSAAGDYFGSSLSLDDTTLAIGAINKNIGTNTYQGAAYVFAGSGSTWTQQAELTAGDGAASDQFGISVSLSNSTVLVGAFGHNNQVGAAYAFVNNGGKWTQQAEITASSGNPGDSFGDSVAIEGDTAVIGAYGVTNSSGAATGAAYSFSRTGSVWSQQGELTASNGADGDGYGVSVSLNNGTALIGANATDNVTGSAYIYQTPTRVNASDRAVGDEFGISVAVDGSTALVGAPGKNGKGAAYIFTSVGSIWTQQAELAAGDGATGDKFGVSVTLKSGTALIGATGKNSSSGTVYVFTGSGSSWTQQTELSAVDRATSDMFGNSLALNNGTALIGADGKNGKGAAYVFTGSGSSWTQQAELTAADAAIYDNFGASVALNGNTALIGANGKNSAQGVVYVFTSSGSTWTQKAELTASDKAMGDNFGISVALNGSTALIGAYGKDSQAGTVYVFANNGTSWIQQTRLNASNRVAGDYFGTSVSYNDSVALIGAPDKILGEGEVYSFTGGGASWTQQGSFIAPDAASNDYFGYSVSLGSGSIAIGAFNKDQKGAVYLINAPVEVADLSIGMSVDNSMPAIGQNVTFTITVNNAGPADATSTVVTDVLPSTLTYVSCSAPGGSCSAAGNTVTFDYADVPANGAVTMTLVAQVNSTATVGGTINNSATVSSSAQDPNLSNNTASVTLNVVNPVPVLIGLNPNSIAQGSGNFMMTVTGTSFLPSSVVLWNGAALATTYNSSMQLTAAVPASDVVKSGTVPVQVMNPAPGGGVSNTLTFLIGKAKFTLSLVSESRDSGTGNVTVTVQLTNLGNAVADNTMLTKARLNSVKQLTSLPIGLGNINIGASATATLTFPGYVGSPGKKGKLALSGTFAGGTWSSTLKFKLP